MMELFVQVCVTCGTRKTPMWRTNTDGQKTLCNACGVRLHREQKKAKIARSGTDGAKSKADAEVQLLPRSRSKSQSLTPEAKVGAGCPPHGPPCRRCLLHFYLSGKFLEIVQPYALPD